MNILQCPLPMPAVQTCRHHRVLRSEYPSRAGAAEATIMDTHTYAGKTAPAFTSGLCVALQYKGSLPGKAASM